VPVVRADACSLVTGVNGPRLRGCIVADCRRITAETTPGTTPVARVHACSRRLRPVLIKFSRAVPVRVFSRFAPVDNADAPLASRRPVSRVESRRANTQSPRFGSRARCAS
jgi:hypothetical protein